MGKLEFFAKSLVKFDDNGDVTVLADEEPKIGDWAAALRAEFGLPDDVMWLEDDRLFAFLNDMAKGDEDGRLSTGSGRGFW